MRLHYRSPRGWLNDPHGVIHRADGYHVFHQHAPETLDWGLGIEWGHAVGDDLFSLRYVGPAIQPGDGDDGIWTGCIVEDDRGPLAYYTSARQPVLGLASVRTARPRDTALTSWDKGDVVVTAPAGLGIRDFRDPFVLRDGDVWRMMVGSDSASGHAMMHGFVSTDGESWAYEGVALSRHRDETEGVWMGALWECPQVIEVDGSWVMLTSVWEAGRLHYAGYAVGEFAGGRFTPRAWGRLTYGTYYAPTVFRDAAGRPCMMAWLREVRGEDWTGCLSLPYELRVDGDRLLAEPHPDLDAHAAPGTAERYTWLPEGLLELTDTATLELDGDVLRLVTPSLTAELPHDGGPVEVVLDDEVVEVRGGRGLLGGPAR